MMSTTLQYGMVAEFLEDLARFAADEADRQQLLQAAVNFRTAVQPLAAENDASGDEAA
jgi:hypothetical protein